MAGSYSHLVNKENGTFQFHLIENMRDAYEACEDCHDIIDRLLAALSKHGKHRDGCAVYRSSVFPKDDPEMSCDCGYETAIAVRVGSAKQ